jgi:hypothetical protein
MDPVVQNSLPMLVTQLRYAEIFSYFLPRWILIMFLVQTGCCIQRSLPRRYLPQLFAVVHEVRRWNVCDIRRVAWLPATYRSLQWTTGNACTNIMSQTASAS